MVDNRCTLVFHALKKAIFPVKTLDVSNDQSEYQHSKEGGKRELFSDCIEQQSHSDANTSFFLTLYLTINEDDGIAGDTTNHIGLD